LTDYRVCIDLWASSKKQVIANFKKEYPELYGHLSDDKPLRDQFSIVRRLND